MSRFYEINNPSHIVYNIAIHGGGALPEGVTLVSYDDYDIDHGIISRVVTSDEFYKKFKSLDKSEPIKVDDSIFKTMDKYSKNSKWGEISKPNYYAEGVECIDVMLQQYGLEVVLNFCLCNAFKYLFRCMKKHESPKEDIQKSQWYLNKYMELYLSNHSNDVEGD